MIAKTFVGARVPTPWVEQIRALAAASGHNDADIVREALGQYLGKTDPHALKSVITDHEERLAKLEAKLASLGRLVGN